jgi:hypothetical protein
MEIIASNTYKYCLNRGSLSLFESSAECKEVKVCFCFVRFLVGLIGGNFQFLSLPSLPRHRFC